MNKYPELSLDEFIKQSNNYHLHFVGVEWNGRRELEHFLKFQKENPELEKELTTDFTPEWEKFQENFRQHKISCEELIRLFSQRLYESYKLMRQYVEEDWVIFH